MAKVFSNQANVHETPNRNNHDLQHKRHISGKAGQLIPFLCMETVPTDMIEIDSAAAINMMSLWYPTQTNMRFIFHYFYVPKRLVMKDWKNFLEGLPDNQTGQSDIERPYLNLPASFYRTGSLADHLGLPTTAILKTPQFLPTTSSSNDLNGLFYTFTSEQLTGITQMINQSDHPIPIRFNRSSTVISPTDWGVPLFTSPCPLHLDEPTSNIDECSFTFSRSSAPATNLSFSLKFMLVGSTSPLDHSSTLMLSVRSRLYNVFSVCGTTFNFTITADTPFSFSLTNQINGFSAFIDWYNFSLSKSPYLYNYLVPLLSSSSSNINSTLAYRFFIRYPEGSNLDIADFPTISPYYGPDNNSADGDNVKISALQFRAYEMIYNAFYRNSHGVQPFTVNGVEQHNNYLTTDANGADTTNYHLFQRNWEQDAYTSCLPSPMQGTQPVISVNALGRLTITDPDGTRSSVLLRDVRDGSQGMELEEVDAVTDEHRHIITSIASSGLSIADFRQGNALTRFLEQSLRSGYRYADFLFGHFGASPSHQELDMPVFLGGYTQVVDVNKVTNVSASGDAPLGEFAGAAAAFGANRHRIKRYFDDYGYIIGIMSLVPDPAYSQLLPKQFTRSGRLDEFFPEFAQLGLQPVTYEEVCPIQSHIQYLTDSTKKMTDTFGYQRPNHEYVWLPDTVHGLFRKSMAGSVVQRVFDTRPELSADFLEIHPEEVNSIFSVTEANDDIFLGQIALKITSKRPIPAVVVPSLGR